MLTASNLALWLSCKTQAWAALPQLIVKMAKPSETRDILLLLQNRRWDIRKINCVTNPNSGGVPKLFQIRVVVQIEYTKFLFLVLAWMSQLALTGQAVAKRCTTNVASLIISYFWWSVASFLQFGWRTLLIAEISSTFAFTLQEARSCIKGPHCESKGHGSGLAALKLFFFTKFYTIYTCSANETEQSNFGFQNLKLHNLSSPATEMVQTEFLLPG